MSTPTASAASAAIAADVRAEMGKQRVNASGLARHTGIPRTTLSRKIAGAQAFTVDELLTVAAALKINPKTLLPTSTS